MSKRWNEIKINFNKLKIAGLIFALSSCAHKPVEQKEETTPLDNISASRAKAIEAAQKAVAADDANRIIGSSHIKAPTQYDKKTYFLYGAEHLNLENYYFDIPVVYNDAVKKWISYFLNRGRGFFERYSARAGRYAPILGNILEEHGLPRDLIFLAMAESGFQTKAKSWAKAVGAWQFMPYTGKRFGLKIDWYMDERRDPIKATIAASKYLTKLYEEFGSWELAAAAYNAGENKMNRAIKRYGTENFWALRRGRYLKSETKNYVPKIMALAIIGKNLKSFGFEDIDFHEPLDFEEIEVKPATDLITLSKELDVEFEEMQRLNPEILRWFTPPTVESYHLRVPVGKKVVWNNCCANKELLASDFMKYKVRGSRSNLADVARKFKIKDDTVLPWLNGIDQKNRLEQGSVVYLPFKDGQNIKDDMYSDLYERPRKSVLRRRSYRNRIKTALRKGKKITSPSQYYTVRRGDSLWTVSQKTGTSLDTIIASNYDIIRSRRIREGDRLVVR